MRVLHYGSSAIIATLLPLATAEIYPSSAGQGGTGVMGGSTESGGTKAPWNGKFLAGLKMPTRTTRTTGPSGDESAGTYAEGLKGGHITMTTRTAIIRKLKGERKELIKQTRAGKSSDDEVKLEKIDQSIKGLTALNAQERELRKFTKTRVGQERPKAPFLS